MNNEDMTRFYEVGTDLGRPGDFVRRDKDGNVPGASTTLNKYTYTQGNYMTAADNIRLMNILRNAKGRVICASWGALMEYGVNEHGCRIRKTYFRNSSSEVTCEIEDWSLKSSGAYSEGYEYKYNMTNNTLTTRTIENGNDPQATISIVITYYNDTEITQ